MKSSNLARKPHDLIKFQIFWDFWNNQKQFLLLVIRVNIHGEFQMLKQLWKTLTLSNSARCQIDNLKEI